MKNDQTTTERKVAEMKKVKYYLLRIFGIMAGMSFKEISSTKRPQILSFRKRPLTKMSSTNWSGI